MANPNAAEIQGRLEPVSTKVAQVLRKSINKSLRFFGPGRKFDPHLFATRMRYESRILFNLESLETAEDEDDDVPTLESPKLTNIGLEVFYDGIVAKILKRVRESPAGLPIPMSEARSKFYCQETGIRFHPKTGEPRTILANTIYIWDYDEKEGLNYLSLVCPRSGWRKKNTVSYFWSTPLSIGRGVSAQSTEYGQELPEPPSFDDLPGYSRPEDDSETGTNDAP